jgi:hypothetical protein
MPFRSGSISYSRFGVSGSLPDDANEGALALLGRHVVKQRALSDEGTLSGWCSGRHVFDADFSWEHCGFSGAILCAMRVDRAKVPPEIRRAYVAMAEDERRGGREGGREVGRRSGRAALARGTARGPRRRRPPLQGGDRRRPLPAHRHGAGPL